MTSIIFVIALGAYFLAGVSGCAEPLNPRQCVCMWGAYGLGYSAGRRAGESRHYADRKQIDELHEELRRTKRCVSLRP